MEQEKQFPSDEEQIEKLIAGFAEHGLVMSRERASQYLQDLRTLIQIVFDHYFDEISGRER